MSGACPTCSSESLQITPSTQPLVGAPPRGEAFRLSAARVRGGTPLLQVGCVGTGLDVWLRA
ncbi:hypothetical protein DP092_10925 [Pseudomonas sp. MDMC224]|nr:hypothetical protein DP092_10925 [Pseudomonas sp. MDMC224]